MIIRLDDYKNKQLPECDLCIIGMGAAGLEIAKEFDNGLINVVCLESGYHHYDPYTQNLCKYYQKGIKIVSPDYSSLFDFKTAKIREIRLRQFGGTLNLWGRRWKPLDEIDFTKKDYYTESGWPLSYSELLPYYHQIAKDYSVLEIFEFEPPELISFEKKYASLQLRKTLKQLNATKIHKAYKQLKSSKNIQVFLGANATNFELSSIKNAVDRVHIKTLDGKEFYISPQTIILACGSIENARLLMNFQNQEKKQLFGDWLGKNFLDHPKGYFGLLKANPAINIPGSCRINQEKKMYLNLTLKQDILINSQLPNYELFFFPSPELGKDIYKIFFFLEQFPNFHSQILLTEEVDKLNLPVVCIDWHLRDIDESKFILFIERIAKEFSNAKIGQLIFNKRIDLNFVEDSSHQMGTTRMSINPRDGVVDTNCKVHHLDNLFIAGSSVFPITGNSNPTFTILALARRLSSYLKAHIFT